MRILPAAFNAGMDQLWFNPEGLPSKGVEPTFTVKQLTEIKDILLKGSSIRIVRIVIVNNFVNEHLIVGTMVEILLDRRSNDISTMVQR